MILKRPAPSIRFRLAGWYALVLFLMLVVYAAATFWAVRHELLAQLDRQLYDDFEAAEGLITHAPQGRLALVDDRHHDSESEADRGIDVWSAAGEEIYRSRATAPLPAVAIETASAEPRYQSMLVTGRRWRTLTRTWTDGGPALVVRVSRSEDRLRAQLEAIVTVLALGLPMVVLLAGGGGYVLAWRALEPIDRLAADARRITADRLHERLSVPNQEDGIGRLAAVINETFARLESSFDRLRRFTADASHELRTPLAVIRGIGEVGLGEPRSPEVYREVIGSMLEEVDRLTTLVETLLRLSHGDAGTVRLSSEPIDLGSLAREVVSSLALLAEERHQRVTIEAPDPVIVSGDHLVLREAITNVVDNAIKYSPQGSAIHARVRADRDHAVLEIADEGPGIAIEHRGRIFDRFFRLDEGRSRDSGGTGLGLAIAKWAVDANDGHITVDAAPAGGAMFRITLPLAAATPVVFDSVQTGRP